MSDRVLISIDGGVATVTLNRADKRNALDNAMFTAVAEAGERLRGERGVRAVVLTGAGKSFCAGLDFASFQAMAGDDRPRRDETPSDTGPGAMVDGRITHLGQQICWVWQELPMPVIAAVHGHALGGGLQLALGADIRISHPDTKWSVREVHWGLVPDMTGSLMLSRLVRPDVAKELTFTARLFSGAEAARLGLVTKLSETPLEEAMALAREIAARSPGAVRSAKALFNRLANDGAAEQFAEERRLIGEQIGSPNQIEAVAAGLENRPPAFADVD